MDLRENLLILRRRWLLIVAGLLLGVAVAALLTIRTTPTYSSTARLFVSTPTSADANSDAYQGALFSQQRVASYADLITGTTIAQMVIDKLGLDENATELAGQFTARAVTSTVILEVSAADEDPVRAQLLAQTLAETFAAYVPQLESAADPDATPIRAVISDAAVVPGSPVSPRPLVNIGLGALLGLLAGLGLAAVRDRLDTTIKSLDTLEEITDAASLGAVHFDPGAAKRPLVTDLDSHAPRLESFRVIRTNLEFLGVDQESKIITITSPLPADGKSTTALNVAITLAQAGRRTLLLEADLRRPRIADYLHLETAVGLTTVLIGRAGVDDVIQKFAAAPDLDVITSGVIPPNPSELLMSSTMKLLLADLRTRYDVVIIDAPPILPVTDAALLAAAGDGAVLVVRHGKTTRDQVLQSRQRLTGVDAALLATVLNFQPRKSAEGYGYGYGYGLDADRHDLPVADEPLRPAGRLRSSAAHPASEPATAPPTPAPVTAPPAPVSPSPAAAPPPPAPVSAPAAEAPPTPSGDSRIRAQTTERHRSR